MRTLRHCLLALCLGLAATAAPRAHADPYEAPLEVRAGPVAWSFIGPVSQDNPVLWGVSLNAGRIVSGETLRDQMEQLPTSWRGNARTVGFVRVSKWWHAAIPTTILVNPPVINGQYADNRGTYGASWRPWFGGLALVTVPNPATATLFVAPRVTVLYLSSDDFPTTLFVRPGVETGFEIEAFSRASRPYSAFSIGISSQFYVPQRLGSFLDVGPLDESAWFVFSGWVRMHFRAHRVLYTATVSEHLPLGATEERASGQHGVIVREHRVEGVHEPCPPVLILGNEYPCLAGGFKRDMTLIDVDQFGE